MGRIVFAAAACAVLCFSGAAPARGAEPRARVDGEMDSSLRTAIVKAIGETDRPLLNRFEARRRAREAAEDAVAVLRSEGYYGYEAIPDVGEGDAPTPVVKVTPGERFVIADPKVDWTAPEPSAPVRALGEAAMGLKEGEPGRAADVVAAEGRVVATVQKQGYADVAAAPREVIVDHADHTVRPTFRIVAGELVRLGGLDLTGARGRTDPDWLRRLAPWRAGKVYDPEDVAELERRLLDTGVYESVTVGLAPKESTTTDGLRPIIVSLADRKRRTLEAGASYSTSEGVGLDARWTRYNVFGRADTQSLSGRLSNIDSRLAAEVALPHWRRPAQTLKLGAAAYSTRTDAYDEKGVGVRADLQRRYGKTSYLTVGGSLDFSRTDERRPGTLTPLGRDLFAIAGLADLSLDRSDDPLNPRRGWRVGMRLEPTLLTGETTLPYLETVALASVYLPLGEAARTVVAARVRAGAMVGGSIPEIPASRRFFAGGGGSVRGYGYQAVGPRLSDNTPQGGVSLLETAFEVRHNLTRRWGVVAFVDAGAVGSDPYPSGKDLSVGAGFGVRYDLGFGPIRADIAVPLEKRQGDAPFQIYISIG
ncbi:MAG: autotransporter assembly complex family protein, partial [Phenylobacterium sp.]|uniref:autotransporter assembly complex protein TamA n=1 Tax=Phenylobacterium sp. TaxID=1871053 RepID=UPI0027359D55